MSFRVPSSAWKVANLWIEVAIYATSVMVIGTELKIFNSVRIQMKLEEQERLLLQARMEALQNQINPHFLFNTLNSVSSLVRFDPDTARELIIKLARILRRLLNSSESFVPLREEVEFIDNYLDIEVVRFGRDKLRVVKELEPESLEMHGARDAASAAGRKFDQAWARVQDRRWQHLSAQPPGRQGGLIIEVEDDGVGMGAAQLIERPNGLGRHGNRHGERRRTVEGSLRRHSAHDHRQPGREGNSGASAVADPAGRLRNPARASTKSAPAPAGRTPHSAE